MKASNKNKKIYIFIPAIILILAVGYFSFAYATKDVWPFLLTDPANSSTTDDGVNYSPPTDSEIQSSQDSKKNNHNIDSNPPSSNEDDKQPLTVDISYAGSSDNKASIEVRAFTTDIIEGTGICNATFTKESTTVSETSKAFIDATSSICEPIEIPLSEFPSSGIWSLTVIYDSLTHKGKSVAIDVEVRK